MEAKGGEVRRIHLIYFLSHMGRVEHPHLIRVHHFNRNGVYLRDVKRWLADLRGKDMPEAFAWSYKRRYKTGYVWQDLLDDDLITPLSDNEYVVKGSEIVSTPFDHASNSYYENKAYILKKQQPVEVEAEAKDQRQQQPSPKEAFQTHPDSKTNTSTDFSSEINEESPLFGSERSTVTNDSIKLEEEKDVEHGGRKLESTSFRSTLLSKKNKKKSNKDDKVEMAAGTPSSSHSSSSPSSETPFRKSKSYSSGASSMLRNLIGCGAAADTNDAAFVMLNRANKTDSSTKPDVKDENFQGEKLGGSARVYGATWNQQQQEQQQQQQQHGTNWKGFDGKQGSQKKKQSGFSQQKAVPAAFKPHCSQCGKPFKPEKLHSHMKSCRGMKALSKTAAEKTQSHGSMTSSQKESACRHLLTN